MTKPVDGAEALAREAYATELDNRGGAGAQFIRRGHDNLWTEAVYPAMLAHSAALVAENGRLREAFGELDHYTTHSIRCALYQQPWISGAPRCSCGLDAARTALETRNG